MIYIKKILFGHEINQVIEENPKNFFAFYHDFENKLSEVILKKEKRKDSYELNEILNDIHNNLQPIYFNEENNNNLLKQEFSYFKRQVNLEEVQHRLTILEDYNVSITEKLEQNSFKKLFKI